VVLAQPKERKRKEKMTLEVEDEERETLSAQDDIPRHALAYHQLLKHDHTRVQL
jgi:hypothetical protein